VVSVLGSVERLEQFWHSLVLTVPWSTDIDGAIVIHCPEMPVPLFNNATRINVKEDEAENLLNRVLNYFSSRRFSICVLSNFPTNSSEVVHLVFLRHHGFERKMNKQSVMVFKGKRWKTD
jgi:hypothetical protein